MSIRFYCEHCRQLLKARDDKIGRRMSCPKCKEPVTVPSEDDLDAVRLGEKKASETDIDPFAALIVYDDEIVYDTGETAREAEEEGEFDRRLVAVSRRVLYGHAVLLATVAIFGFVAGYLVGHTTREAPKVLEPEPQRVVIDGRLQWEASTGMLADKGAVVIALPEDVQPNQKLPGESLGPDKPMPGQESEMIQTIEKWGGDYTRTNDVGEFELFLLPGRYKVLLVSHQSRRVGNAEPNRNHLVDLSAYFTAPHELIGPFNYQWTTQEFGEESQVFHDFEIIE